MTVVLRGLVIGFAVAAPVGPIGVLCIRRSLAFGRADGLVVGLGAATADAFYGAVAAFGLSAVSDTLVRHTQPMRLAGGAFLLFLAARTAFARPGARAADAPRARLRSYGTAVALTLTNPATILSFAAVYTSFGFAGITGSVGTAAILVGGVFAGSAAWWLFLSAAASALGARMRDGALRWMNRASAAVLAAFGAGAIASAF